FSRTIQASTFAGSNWPQSGLSSGAGSIIVRKEKIVRRLFVSAIAPLILSCGISIALGQTPTPTPTPTPSPTPTPTPTPTPSPTPPPSPTAAPSPTPTPTPQQVFTRVNLVSDIAGVANFTDPNLVNPWRLGFGPPSPFWVADNGTGVSTLY